MAQPELAFRFATRGMNAALDPSLLGEDMLARAVNVRIDNQLPRTRWGVREIRVADGSGDWAEWRKTNLQGSIYYNPAAGLSGRSYGTSYDTLLESAAGRRFLMRIVGPAKGESIAVLDEVTGDYPGNPRHLLTWLCQAENYAIHSDGNGDTWIYDGRSDPWTSPGYSIEDKAASKLCNAATICAYSNYRIHQVVNGRQVVVGDPLHRSNLSDSRNLLETTEQVHQNTGQYFSPPANMGAIRAMASVPIRDNRWGNADPWIHCEGGIFQIPTAVPDRSTWSNEPVKLRDYKDGAFSQYALDVYDQAQVFLSSRGIEMLFAAAGSSVTLISPEVATFLLADHLPDRRFSSLVNHNDRRLYCTVNPVVRGTHRSNRGAVVLNWDPTETKTRNDAAVRAWEGLMVLPAELGEIAQFVAANVSGEKRLFAHCWEPHQEDGLLDGDRHLVEVTDWQDGYDTHLDDLSNSRKLRVSSAIWTRVLDGSRYFNPSNFTDLVLYLRDVLGELDWGIYYRVDHDQRWNTWDEGSVTVQRKFGESTRSKSFALKLNSFPCKAQQGRFIQLMIRWRGTASIEGVGVWSDAPGTIDLTPDCTKKARVFDADTDITLYDDFEAASDRNGWGMKS